jgi:hypothetical protein
MAPLRGSARPAVPRPRAGSLFCCADPPETPLLAAAQVMGSLACDEGEAATPAPGAARRDALEPSLRARFKDMQKIGEGTYGVACQRSKKWEAWRGEWHRGFWRLVTVPGG